MSASIERQINWDYVFPQTPDFYMPVLSAELVQKQGAHDVLILRFKGALQRHSGSPIKTGEPIQFTWKSGVNSCTFVGFVHTIEKNTTAGNTFTKIICVNNSEMLKKSGKRIFKNVTADQVAASIAKENDLSCDTSRHPYEHKHIAQAGQSYWQLLRRLSKSTGYALRAENTDLIFKNPDKIIAEKIATAPVFVHNDLGPPGLIANQTLISFTALDSKNSAEVDQGDLGISVSGTDGTTYTFETSRKIDNGYSFGDTITTSNTWQETYGIVPDTTIDGLGG
jgi:hypothetical protein